MRKAWTLGSSAWRASMVTAGDSCSAWEPKRLCVTSTRPRSLLCFHLDRWIAARSNGGDAAARDKGAGLDWILGFFECCWAPKRAM
ncbi:hypothetical protein V6N13_115171 [Hibiscus sabdariffa]